MTVAEAVNLLSGLPPASVIRSFSPRRGFILATQTILTAGHPADVPRQLAKVPEVLHAVADEFGILPSQIPLHGLKKNAIVTEARSVAAYALVLSGWSLRSLSGHLGYRGHVGPLNAVQRCHELRSIDLVFNASVGRVLDRLNIRDTSGFPNSKACQR